MRVLPSRRRLTVLAAVRDGLLDLDEPISSYLPEFTVGSVHEDRPQDRMTLRHLLSHTAGFVHEAPVGNNYEVGDASFEEHVASISETWLRFPVGERFGYSNLGIDLAASIVARTRGAEAPNPGPAQPAEEVRPAPVPMP